MLYLYMRAWITVQGSFHTKNNSSKVKSARWELFLPYFTQNISCAHVWHLMKLNAFLRNLLIIIKTLPIKYRVILSSSFNGKINSTQKHQHKEIVLLEFKGDSSKLQATVSRKPKTSSITQKRGMVDAKHPPQFYRWRHLVEIFEW